MILVTGATGFVGFHLVNALLTQHKKIRCLVRSDIPELSKLCNEIEIIKGDIRDSDTVSSAVKGTQQVVHLAAKVQDHKSETMRQVNVEGTKNLVYSSVRYGIEKFVFLSTLNVVLPVKNQYSISKLEAERIIRESGLNFTILRPSIIYGLGDDGTIAKLINSVKTKKTIFLIGDGNYKLQPIYIDDVVNAIGEVLNDSNKFKNRTFFLVGNDTISYNELVDLISDIFGVKRRKFHIPLFVTRNVIRLISICYKNGIQLKDAIKTYPFNKVTDEKSQKNVFPLQVMPLKEGISRYIKSIDTLLC